MQPESLFTASLQTPFCRGQCPERHLSGHFCRKVICDRLHAARFLHHFCHMICHRITESARFRSSRSNPTQSKTFCRACPQPAGRAKSAGMSPRGSWLSVELRHLGSDTDAGEKQSGHKEAQGASWSPGRERSHRYCQKLCEWHWSGRFAFTQSFAPLTWAPSLAPFQVSLPESQKRKSSKSHSFDPTFIYLCNVICFDCLCPKPDP